MYSDKQIQQLHNELNKAIIKCRSVYSLWSKEHDISYNRMLVLYTIREYGFCTQKQICDSYLLPRQTINNTIAKMRNEGLLEISPQNSNGKEKAFVLTDKGSKYAKRLLKSLNDVEQRTVKMVGKEKIIAMTETVLEFDNALMKALEESANKNSGDTIKPVNKNKNKSGNENE